MRWPARYQRCGALLNINSVIMIEEVP